MTTSNPQQPRFRHLGGLNVVLGVGGTGMNVYLWALVGALAGVLVGLALPVAGRHLLQRVAPLAEAAEQPAPAARDAAHRETRRFGPGAAPLPGRKRNPANFRATSIRSGQQACPAVKDLAGRRFLSSDAPPLPLAGCDQATCKCTYVHHADRRSSHDDRRTGWGTYGGFQPAIPGGNRRSRRPDRRRH